MRPTSVRGFLIVAIISVFTWRCSAKCFTFMGFNSCMTQFHGLDEEFPFTPEWFFVNVFKRVNMIKLVKQHFFEIRLVEMSVNLYKPLREAKDMMDLDEFWKTIAQVVEYIESVRGDPIELLYDEKINPMDLFRSFRNHAEEIIEFVKSADEGGAFSEDVRQELERLCHLMRAAGRTLHNLPEFTDSTYFRMIEQNAYRDPKIAALAALAEQMMPSASK